LNLCVLDEIFEQVIKKHCHWIKDKKYYKENHNHGFNQDIALYVSAIVYHRYFNDHTFLEYKDQAKKRIFVQLDYLINEDGTFKEQSLEGAYLLFVRLVQFYHFMLEHDREDQLNAFIRNKLNNLLVFLYVLVEPKGLLPPIGDSNYFSINVNQIKEYEDRVADYFDYLIEEGRAGKSLTYLDVFFPMGNYFVSVNKNILYPHFTKLIFYCAFHSTIHKHHDDLSFLLYYKNLLIFIDGGKYNYQYDNFYRQAVTSVYAHNTICVDKHNYLIDEININKSGITNVSKVDDIILISGISCLYENVLIRRDLLYVKNDSLYIIDQIESNQKHQYEIIFNINPRIQLKKEKSGYRGYYQEKPIFSLDLIFSSMEVDSKHYYGDQKELKGWFSQQSNQIEPSHCVIFQGKNKEGLFITKISLRDHVIHNAKMEIKQNQLFLKVDENEYSINHQKYHSELFKNNLPIQKRLNINPVLKKTINDFYSTNKLGYQHE